MCSIKNFVSKVQDTGTEWTMNERAETNIATHSNGWTAMQYSGFGARPLLLPGWFLYQTELHSGGEQTG